MRSQECLAVSLFGLITPLLHRSLRATTFLLVRNCKGQVQELGGGCGLEYIAMVKEGKVWLGKGTESLGHLLLLRKSGQSTAAEKSGGGGSGPAGPTGDIRGPANGASFFSSVSASCDGFKELVQAGSFKNQTSIFSQFSRTQSKIKVWAGPCSL